MLMKKTLTLPIICTMHNDVCVYHDFNKAWGTIKEIALASIREYLLLLHGYSLMLRSIRFFCP